MSCDLEDTIAAVASAPGGAVRGIVRISGPQVVETLSACFLPREARSSPSSIRTASRIEGAFRVAKNGRDGELKIPGQLLFWPSSHSYTRQPSAEFHTIGSPPLLAAILEELARHGVRTAEPGEFTLRAFLAGRIDLTQAEAVLGVIDARDRADLDLALDQLAGGLSRPLRRIREELLAALAELEAGLDFAEEDIEFISRAAIRARLGDAKHVVTETLSQLSSRDVRQDHPCVVILGPPNAGKSSLFNALAARYGTPSSAKSIVSPQPGATRDFVSAPISIDGAACLLIDTAGQEARFVDEVHAQSQFMSEQQGRHADLRLRCLDDASQMVCEASELQIDDICVSTKCDLLTGSREISDEVVARLRCSSVTGEGLDELAANIRSRLVGSDDNSHGTLASITSIRCSASLRNAEQALASAMTIAATGGDELIAAEIRVALDALGDVVGATTADDVLDRIFSQFCIGK